MINLEALQNAPRLLLEAKLKPIAGTRFQPTSFPDLGPAQYKLPDGTNMLLVESAQSMANRLEAVCWDTVANDWVEPLRGLPCVVVTDKKGQFLTCTVLEAHRLNSIYIKRAARGDFHKKLAGELVPDPDRPVDLKRLTAALLKYDVNSLIHGVFLESIDGRLRIPRALIGFIEAKGVQVAASGGVKNDRIDPDKTLELPPVDSGVNTEKDRERQGNLPFYREEFCGDITAYFSLDLALIRGFGLGADVERLLVVLALFKILRFLRDGLRLRTACDLELDGALTVKRPDGFALPTLEEVEKELPNLIQKVADRFAKPPKTEVVFEEAAKAKKAEAETTEG